MRIITYNTRGSLGMDGIRSTPRIAEVVRNLSPDIVCFQEIHQRLAWSGSENQPAALGQMLNRPFVFQRNLVFAFGGYGVGIAYSGRLVSSHEHLMPSGKEQRGALEVRLRHIAGFRELTVFCTHWGLDPQERLQQAEFLVERVRHASHPVVLCGDFNEGDEENAVQRLLTGTGLVDADARRRRPTFVSDNPTVRIDFVLFSPDLVATHVEVVSSLASDHLPVLVDLERRE